MDGTIVLYEPGVLQHSWRVEVEGGQELCVEKLISNFSHVVLSIDLDMGTPENNFSHSEINAPPSLCSDGCCNIIADSPFINVEDEWFPSRTAGSKSNQGMGGPRLEV